MKTYKNTSKVFDQDQMVNVSPVIHNTCDMEISRRSFQDPIEAT